MSQSGVNKGRRRFLLGATSAIGAVGAVELQRLLLPHGIQVPKQKQLVHR